MFIQIQERSDIAILCLNRPEKAHAYTRKMLEELHNQFHSLCKRYRVLVLSSTGERHFCAGADLNELSHQTAEDALDLYSQKVFEDIAQSPTITIAALKGPAIAGGMELALACDLRVSAPRTYWKLPEVSIGLIPSAGGCTRLTGLIGMSRAKAVIIGGETIDADDALSWGITNRVSETPEQEAIRWAEQIAKQDPLALRLAKQVLANPSPEAERVAEAVLYERRNSS